MIDAKRQIWVAERQDDDGEWAALPQYAAFTATGVLEQVVATARAEGHADIDARLEALGWRIVPYIPVEGW